MDDFHDLVLAMFGVAVAAVMLVAGELYLVTRPDPPAINSEPPAVVTSSVDSNCGNAAVADERSLQVSCRDRHDQINPRRLGAPATTAEAMD